MELREDHTWQWPKGCGRGHVAKIGSLAKKEPSVGRLVEEESERQLPLTEQVGKIGRTKRKKKKKRKKKERKKEQSEREEKPTGSPPLLPAFGRSELGGPRVKAALPEESYAWVPK